MTPPQWDGFSPEHRTRMAGLAVYPQRYAIMDERAYEDVDRAAIMSVQFEQDTLEDLQQERDQSWPGYPIVNLATWEILAE